MIKLNLDGINDFIKLDEINNFKHITNIKNLLLESKKGKGGDFLGWKDIPSTITESLIIDINNTAAKLRKISDAVVIVGIGGSYLGARAVISALSNNFDNILIKEHRKTPLILYAGNNLCEDYISELLSVLDNISYSIVVISKSGTTTEPAVAFRLLKNHIEKKYSKEEVKQRIIAITDEKSGALLKVAKEEGYKTYIIPDNIGGRFSVLTPVGLLPISIAGIDITKLIKGAKTVESISKYDFDNNIISKYAVIRLILYLNKNKNIEILGSYNPKLFYLIEWWKQLFGESEGKEKKGIFPAGISYTADLHSMGQYVQEGQRNLFETIIEIEEANSILNVPIDENNVDGLNFLSNKRINEINKMAILGTKLAHVDGGVPNIFISIPKLNEEYLGQLIYFFERSCALYGYLLSINPFDQPGVEFYKENMFALLKKPGYEAKTKTILERLRNFQK